MNLPLCLERNNRICGEREHCVYRIHRASQGVLHEPLRPGARSSKGSSGSRPSTRTGSLGLVLFIFWLISCPSSHHPPIILPSSSHHPIFSTSLSSLSSLLRLLVGFRFWIFWCMAHARNSLAWMPIAGEIGISYKVMACHGINVVCNLAFGNVPLHHFLWFRMNPYWLDTWQRCCISWLGRASWEMSGKQSQPRSRRSYTGPVICNCPNAHWVDTVDTIIIYNSLDNHTGCSLSAGCYTFFGNLVGPVVKCSASNGFNIASLLA